MAGLELRYLRYLMGLEAPLDGMRRNPYRVTFLPVPLTFRLTILAVISS